MVEHFKAHELRVHKASLPVVLNRHDLAGVKAAGDSDSLCLKIQPFVKIRIKLTTGTNRNRRRFNDDVWVSSWNIVNSDNQAFEFLCSV